MEINICSCAEEALRDDIQSGSKTYKQIGAELRPDLSVQSAQQVLLNALNPKQEDAHIKAEAAIRVCLICGKSFNYLLYVFNRLKHLLNEDESLKFLVFAASELIKANDTQKEVFITHLNDNFGYKKPVKIDGSLAPLESEKLRLTTEIQENMRSIFNKMEKIEKIEAELTPIIQLKE